MQYSRRVTRALSVTMQKESDTPAHPESGADTNTVATEVHAPG